MPWRSNGAINPKLAFRNAKEEEASSLKELYENAWGCGITIDERQIVAKIRSFPEGQIVGCESGGGSPVAMINIMLTDFDPRTGFVPGYEKVTGARTFSTHVPFPELLERLASGGRLPVALCMSIAVHKSYVKNGYAIETLNHAISFAEENGIIAVPYSAPRGFASALGKNPHLDLESYLHMTAPAGMSYDEHVGRMDRLNAVPRISRAFKNGNGKGSLRVVTEALYSEYQGMCADSPLMDRKDVAYNKFSGMDGEAFYQAYGRYPHIEDFCLMTGRRLIDPVMRMHVDNGARFIRDGDGNLTALFRDSRPEDTAAAGYNVLLTYGYHQLLGQNYVD